jgi:hypothetical protein
MVVKAVFPDVIDAGVPKYAFSEHGRRYMIEEWLEPPVPQLRLPVVMNGSPDLYEMECMSE